MNKRKIILLAAASFVALLTVFIARAMMAPSGKASTPAPTDEILAAAHDLPAGTLLKEDDLEWIAWPVSALSPSLYVKGKADKAKLAGEVLRETVGEGDPLMSGELVKPHDEGFLAAVLKPGMRAMAIPVTGNSDVAGFIFPGDHVDVILTQAVNRKNYPALDGRHVSETILSDIRVLALDQKTDTGTTPAVAKLATLEVTPQQAEKLALASQLGTISLSLRSLARANGNVTSPANGAAANAKPAQMWDSDLSQAFPSPGGVDSLLQKVQVMRGGATTETTFERHP